MRQSITTKYLGPSNTRGSRIKAVARRRSSLGAEMSLTDSWDCAHNSEENHCRVAKLLAAKLGWFGLWVGGGNVDEDGYVFVNVADAYEGAPDSNIGTEGRDWFYVARQAVPA